MTRSEPTPRARRPAPVRRFSKKDLLDIESITEDDIRLVLDTAESMREINQRSIKKVPTLRGKLVANLFFENSTRTRFSFEIAERRLSADSIALLGGRARRSRRARRSSTRRRTSWRWRPTRSSSATRARARRTSSRGTSRARS